MELIPGCQNIKKIRVKNGTQMPEPRCLSRTRPRTRESRFSNPDPARNPELRAGSTWTAKTLPFAHLSTKTYGLLSVGDFPVPGGAALGGVCGDGVESLLALERAALVGTVDDVHRRRVVVVELGAVGHLGRLGSLSRGGNYSEKAIFYQKFISTCKKCLETV